MVVTQARAHNLLRQKDADLSTAKELVTQQFQADLVAAEAATAAAQQQVEQVCCHAVSWLLQNICAAVTHSLLRSCRYDSLGMHISLGFLGLAVMPCQYAFSLCLALPCPSLPY